MKKYKLIKIGFYPSQEKRGFLRQTKENFRFINKKMLEDRIRVYKQLKDEKGALYIYKYEIEGHTF